jgi:integrase/recombinase XerD
MAQVSPLRRRMIEDMTVRNMSPATQRSYISAVSKFSRYFGKSPERLGLEDVRAFQVHLVSTGVSWPGLNQNRLRLAVLLWRHAGRGRRSRAYPLAVFLVAPLLRLRFKQPVGNLAECHLI